MLVRGEPANIGKAMLLISQLLLDANTTAGPDKQAATDVRILFHKNQAGAIIGKGGATIKQFMADSGAKIRVTTDALPMTTEKSCIIVGTPAQIQIAVEAVVAKLIEHPLPENIESVQYLSNVMPQYAAPQAPYGYGAPQVNPYNPYMVNPAAARAPVVMPQNGPGGDVQMEFELLVPAECGGAIIGKGGQSVKNIKQASECNVSVGEADASAGTRTVKVRGAACKIPVALRMIQDFAEPVGTATQTEAISIPSACSGAVIGKQGRTINEMKGLSGCNISLAEPCAEAPEMRTVNITGTNVAIQIAAFLLRQRCELQNAMVAGLENAPQ